MENSATLELERMTWPQVRAALDAGRTTVVFACGAVEQHGPHLPLFTDAEHGSELSRRVASDSARRSSRRRCESAAPSITWRSPGRFHRRVDLRGRTWTCAKPRSARVPAICVIRRTAETSAIGARLSMLRETGRARARLGVHGLAGGDRRLDGLRPRGLAERVGGHADIAESSVMLALHPELVRTDRRGGHVGPLTPELIQRLFTEGMRHFAERNSGRCTRALRGVGGAASRSS
jgi:creatinine amidohydrolase